MSSKVTAKAVSQVQNQLPAFIGDEFPLYQKFMEHYYEFLEALCIYYKVIDDFGSAFTLGETVTGQTSGAIATVKATAAFTAKNKLFIEPTNDINFLPAEIIVGSSSSARVTIDYLNRHPLNATKTFQDLLNTDETSEGLLEAFKKELYPNIRNSASADLRKFVKHLKSFYRSKGSQKSFKTLFRLLYGQENLDFYYPKTDLLKVSAGNWSQDTVLQLAYDVNYLDFNGLTITGITSGATAFVSSITTRKLGTIPIIELILTNRSTTPFTIGETITATTAAGATITATVTGQMTDVTISDGGTGYDVGDSLTITDSSLAGFGAVATVATTTADQVTIMTIDAAGNGFEVNDAFTFDNTGTNVDVTAEAKVKTLSDTYSLSVITTKISVAVQTSSFNISGATTALPFSVSVQVGYRIGNNETYSSATKKGEIISISNSEIVIYDESRADGTLSAWADGDPVFLFDEDGVAIDGATSCTIDDSSIVNPTSDVTLNSSFGASLNNATISSTFTSAMTSETKTFGRIATIEITSHGSGYEAIPTVTIENDYYSNFSEVDSTYGGIKGRNATITVGALGGTMTGVTISEEGFGYVASPAVTAPVNSTAATLVPVMTAIKTKDGSFVGEEGMPSSQMKMQDNDFYQDYSYVLQTTDSVDVWKQDVLKLLHPAGFKVFGEVVIATDLNGRMFARGVNNINSILDDGIAQYRSLERDFLTEVLATQSEMLLDSTDGSANAGDNILLEDPFENYPGKLLNETDFRRVTAETEVSFEVEIIEDLFDAFAFTNIMLEDGALLKDETGSSLRYEQYLPESVTETVIEYLRLLLATNSSPADFFALMSVKTAVNLSTDTSLHLEYATDEGGVFLLEDGNNLLAEEGRTTITTSDPHYFKEGAQIYLDEFEGTNVDTINGRLYEVSDVDVENSKIILETTGGIILENDDDGYLRNEDIANFTLSNPRTAEAYDDIDLSDVSVTTYGKVFKPADEVSVGVPNNLFRNEYIGEYASNVIDNYQYFCPSDFSSLADNSEFVIRSRKLSIESNILLEDDEEILLEDGVPTTSGTYSGTSSAIGKLLADEGSLDQNISVEEDNIVITDAYQRKVRTTYITDEDIYADDRIVLEDADSNGRIITEESTIQNGIIPFVQPLLHKGHPHESNNGFMYINHRIDQRVSV